VALMLDKSRQTTFTSRRNLLVYSEDFAAINWLVFGGASKTGTNIGVAPDGTTTADGIRVTTAGTGSNIYQQQTYTVAAVPYTFSCYVKRNAASDQTFQLFNNLQGAQASSGNLTATDTWQRFSHTSTSNAGSGTMLVGVIGNTAGAQADLQVWGAQLEVGSTAAAYQAVITLPTSWTGNHATQATAASRPTYGVVPLGGRRNLLTWSEDFRNTAAAGVTRPWTWLSSNVTANTATAPDGTVTADLVTATAGSACHYVFQTVSTSGSVTCTVYAKAGTANWLGLSSGYTNGGETAWFDLATGTRGTVASGGTSTMDPVVGYPGWWRCSHTRSSWTGGGAMPFVTSADGVAVFNAAGTENLLLWGSQLELGSTATAYQRVTTQYDVTEAGVQSLSYLFFDGVSNFMGMATGAITPGTDKVQVFAGLRKLSDATAGCLVELGPNISANARTFALFAPGTGGSADYYFGTRGTVLQNLQTSTVYPAPISNVVTALSDISGDTASLRVNGTQAVLNTGDQGTGNFDSYPLNIGRRSGGTLPMNGQLFGLITRFGPNLDATTINVTETWVNGKTGAY
jgi:hypothetical protein